MTELEITQLAEHSAQTIAPLFNLYGWTWCDKKIPPSIFEIEDHIEGLIYDAINEEDTVSSGRVTVAYCKRDVNVYLDIGKFSK